MVSKLICFAFLASTSIAIKLNNPPQSLAEFKPHNKEDEIIDGMLFVENGEIRHQPTKEAL